MEPMHDKEFDQFFKDKFREAEVAPPAMLWNKVDAQLGPVPKKRFPVLWMAAAIAVVAVSAGLLFNQQEDSPFLGQPVAVNSTEKPAVKSVPETAVSEIIVLPTPSEGKQPAPLSPIIGKHATINEVTPANKVENTPVKKLVKKELLAMQPSGEDQHLDNSRNEVKPAVTETLLVQDEPALALSTPGEPAMSSVSETPQQDAQANEYNAIPERKAISNVGDLVNFVVDKIDKREEKFLQFNANDDDQSSLVSINIGIIKLNTKQKGKR
jgi:hypothetical protein